MAYDDIEFEYHLTSDGWKTGDPPSNRIETWICHQYQASPYSRTLVQWRPKWIRTYRVPTATSFAPSTKSLWGGQGGLAQNGLYPLSPRIVALKEILGQLRPEPARPAPLPPRRNYEPPSEGRYGRRRG